MSETIQHITDLSSVQKRALLAELMKKKADTLDSFYPLSYGQRAWWFMHQLESESTACNIVFSSRVHSEVDVPALRRAFQTLIDRHPSLRTNFVSRNNEPVQFVRRRMRLRFEHKTVDGSNPEDLKRSLIEDANRPFDLEREPMLRVCLYTLSTHEHILLMMAHHIAVDLWSLVVLMNELRELYPAEKKGQRLNLPLPALAYTDYVQEQSQMLASEKGERLWAYWKNRLAGELPVLNLPTDRPRPPVLTYDGAYHDIEIDAETTHQLKGVGQTFGATLFSTLLAAFQVLLYRYSGQKEILVGSLYATGRNRPGFAGVVGFLDNPVVLRADLSGNPAFKDYLEQVSLNSLEALEHQEYPFGLLVERLQPVRELSRAPIFQVMFILQKTQLAEEASLLAMARGHRGAHVNLGGLSLEYVDFEKRVATGIAGRLDLTLTVAETSEGLSASFQYNTELFDATTMARMAGHFQELLKGIVANPSTPIEHLPLLSESERNRQLIDWNRTQAEFPQAERLHTLMTKRAELEPDRVAICFGGETCSYGELDRRSNQLARYLLTLGVRRGVLVGISVERSMEMVVGLLGILKAGAAYVPLDPAYPRQRIAFMLEDVRASVLLTQQKFVATLPPTPGQTVCLDSDWNLIAGESDSPLVDDSTSGDIAYVIYTSGSTGNPKGVMIDHRGAVNTIIDVNRRFSVGPDDRILALSSLSFDLSVYDVFGALAAGAAIVVPDVSTTPNPGHWAELMWREQVTIWNSAPALMEMFVEHLASSSEAMPDSLRLVMMSGDWIPVALPKQIESLAANARVISLGGATEASIWSILFPIEKVDPSWKSIPYGRPMLNQHFYVLDSHGEPVPPGVVGELSIGGIGVAKGYLHRSELSAEKFVPDPFNGEPGGHLYRTGDLGRFLPDGNIEFLGRMDHQVKIRGFRIELGEIEGVLAQHPSVREAVVLARADGQSEKRLVAYIVARQDAASADSEAETSTSTASPANDVGQSELRRFLREKLPEYMVPAHFVTLGAIPLSPNGKVDRRALPAPASVGGELERVAVAPRTSTEAALAGIWAQVIGDERVSIDDNFFDSGGDSLLATQLVSRVRSAFQTELPLQNLFEFPTIAGLAARIEQVLQEKRGEFFQPIQPVTRDAELPLSFAQQRIWFLDQMIPDSAFYNVLAAARMKGTLDKDVLVKSLNEIIRRHETLRTTFTEINGQPVQTIAADGALALTEIDLRSVPEDEQNDHVQRLAKAEARRPFDLSSGPLFRVSLLCLKEDEYVLLLTLHHIIFDGWSLGVLAKELGVLYESYAEGKPSPLAPLAIQYADFAHWQRQWLQGAVLEQQLDYWKRQLAGSTVLQLPTDRPRPAAHTLNGARQSFLLPVELIESLKAFSNREGATLFMTLLAGFKTLLHRYTGQEDIVVGSPIANRNRVETDKLIGFFVNALALRTDLGGNPFFRELLGRVRRTAFDAYAHQDLPFEKLVEELQPDRDLKYTPIFQVWFVLQNAPIPPLELSNITLSPIEVDDGTSKFDIIISLFETADGLLATWIYNTDLFDAPTIARLSKHYETLLTSIVAQPGARLSELVMQTGAEMEQRATEHKERQESRSRRLKNVRRRAVDLSRVDLIKTGYLGAGESFPLVISPQVEQVDLIDWAKNNQPYIESELSKHGAILFRGFNIASATEFEQFALANCEELFGEYGDLPRAEVSGKVYGSTPYPADQPILLHNESSQMHCWPRKVWFYCALAAEQGGETPVVDCRRVYQLMRPEVRERFERLGLVYVRNFTDGLDVGWQEFFRTTERAEVEDYCRRVNLEFEWTAGNGLRTRKLCPAVLKHPGTSEMVFFNQIQAHHISFLDASVRRSLLSLFEMESLPRNVYYGDGTVIEDAAIDEIRRVYRQAQVSFAWQVGDIMMLDNMLAAHGRNPYTGARKIMVTMGEMFHADNLK